MSNNIIIHTSYHKCLTKYYSQVVSSILNSLPFKKNQYIHLNSHLDQLNENIKKHRLVSINNHSLEDLLEDNNNIKVSRFIRDPRDLIVSGYFYHKKGAEPWCNVPISQTKDWGFVNGTFPDNIKPNESFSEFLNRIPEEDGLIAEIQFRQNHFESMRGWPIDDNRVLLIKFEDLVNNEEYYFKQLFDFYGFNYIEKVIGTYTANKFKAKKIRNSNTHLAQHMRDASKKQWEKVFTPKVSDFFNTHYKDILIKYGYEKNES